VVPYHPELHRLVTEKQAWAKPLSEAERTRGFLGWHQRGYLPHRDAPGLVQFVTFRLADALPASRRAEWEALLKIETNRERRLKLEEYLDHGLGECWLGRPEIAEVVESALRFFDGQRYQLRAWVVMPNHVHVLMETGSEPLAKVIQSWKSFTAKAANRLLGRTGAFWEREYWDTWMRDEAQERKALRYIENNPVKAKLVAEATAWRWSSARLRDEFGQLPTVDGAPSCTRLTPPQGAALPA
jgi:REP element-mobilizing transposase RayT